MSTALDPQQVRDLPAVVDVATAAAVLGVSRAYVYASIRTHSWPTPVLRLGKSIRLPSAPLLELVGVVR